MKRGLTAKAQTLSPDTYLTRVESAEQDTGEDLSPEEFNLEQIGLTADKIKYITQYFSYEHPDVPLKTIYSAVGTALKRYSFRSVLLAAKTLRNVEGTTLFPRFIYACKSFYATETSKVDTAQVMSGLKNLEDSAKLRSLLKTPDDTLFSFLLEGAITKEQYASVKDSEDKCKALIREVVGTESGGAA
jgi:hypothetical protein